MNLNFLLVGLQELIKFLAYAVCIDRIAIPWVIANLHDRNYKASMLY
ncbi:MAG: hypothetical protein ACO1OT_00200 [Heyndrickxia sp.]